MLNIILFGPPGSGKGTQSEKLIHKYKLVHLSTGDLLRSEIAAKTELGVQAKLIIESGELVSDEIVVGMIRNKINANLDSNGFIFDGFPRTVNQAKALDNLLAETGKSISLMVTLEVPDEEVINRLLKRGLENGRTDDNMTTIEHRLNVYLCQTAPVIDYYQARNKYRPVDGIGTIDEIYARIEQEIHKVNH